MPPPAEPKIFHITHKDNLPGIIGDGVIWSEDEIIRREINCNLVGMSEIKRRRLEEIKVECCPGTKVGEYAPFFYCPRSIMLFLLYKANHPDLAYRGGQRPIVHLQADLTEAIRWAEAEGKLWAISDGNASTGYVNFSKDLDDVHWPSVQSNDFRKSHFIDGKQVHEYKQAEFLLMESFPWSLVEKIGVIDQDTADTVIELLKEKSDKALVKVERNWYF